MLYQRQIVFGGIEPFSANWTHKASAPLEKNLGSGLKDCNLLILENPRRDVVDKPDKL
jgi:hypothetical protein